MTLATVQVASNHMWLVATILDSTDQGHFHPYRKFYWATLTLKGLLNSYQNINCGNMEVTWDKMLSEKEIGYIIYTCMS